MPMESFSFRGRELVSRTRLLWILKLARDYGLGWKTKRRNTDHGYHGVDLLLLLLLLVCV